MNHQCKCLTLHNKRCRRKISGKIDFCFQHNICKKIVMKKYILIRFFDNEEEESIEFKTINNNKAMDIGKLLFVDMSDIHDLYNPKEFESKNINLKQILVNSNITENDLDTSQDMLGYFYDMVKFDDENVDEDFEPNQIAVFYWDSHNIDDRHSKGKLFYI